MPQKGTTTVADITHNGAVNVAELREIAIGLDHKARIDRGDLDVMRRRLAGNALALDHIGGLLRYANANLQRMGRAEIRTRGDIVVFEADYGNETTWVFIRA